MSPHANNAVPECRPPAGLCPSIQLKENILAVIFRVAGVLEEDDPLVGSRG